MKPESLIRIPKNYFDVALFLVASQPWICAFITRLFPEEAGTIISGFFSVMWIAGASYMMVTGAKP